MEKKRLTVRLDPEIYKALKWIRENCTGHYISINSHVNMALKKYIREYFEQHPLCKSDFEAHKRYEK